MEKDKNFLIGIDVLLENYDKHNQQKVVPVLNKKADKIIKKLYKICKNLYIIADINYMLAKKIISDSNFSKYIKDVVLFENQVKPCFYLNKLTLNINETCKETQKLSEDLNEIINLTYNFQ